MKIEKFFEYLTTNSDKIASARDRETMQSNEYIVSAKYTQLKVQLLYN